MMFKIINKLSLSQKKKLDQLFRPEGYFVPVPASQLQKLDIDIIYAFCYENAIYGVITDEVIDIFKLLIRGRKCIEVGAGTGTLGRALGVPMYDNYSQTRKDIILTYALAGQPVIKYGQDVIKQDGLQAVKRIKPAVVIGSWITHKYNEKKHHLGGNKYGFEQTELFNYGVEAFIMYGNLKTHKHNPLLKNHNYKVQIFKTKGMYSRAGANDNVIFYITKK